MSSTDEVQGEGSCTMDVGKVAGREAVQWRERNGEEGFHCGVGRKGK